MVYTGLDVPSQVLKQYGERVMHVTVDYFNGYTNQLLDKVLDGYRKERAPPEQFCAIPYINDGRYLDGVEDMTWNISANGREYNVEGYWTLVPDLPKQFMENRVLFSDLVYLEYI